MIIILNKIDVITTYGKLLYESINNEVVMKKIEDRSTRNNNATANIQDYKLSRYICYLIVQNADPSKKVVALG